ncbi:MAG: hypothetical protein C4294_08110, partial [Nitrospiraceae bacterium]
NALAYFPAADEPFSVGDQDRNGSSGGVRLDYTNVFNKNHLIKAGFQIDRTQAVNKTRLFLFERDPGTGKPTTV